MCRQIFLHVPNSHNCLYQEKIRHQTGIFQLCFFTFSKFLAAIMTISPACLKRCAVLRPKPLVPLVINTTFDMTIPLHQAVNYISLHRYLYSSASASAGASSGSQPVNPIFGRLAIIAISSSVSSKSKIFEFSAIRSALTDFVRGLTPH